MNQTRNHATGLSVMLATLLLMGLSDLALARIDGVTGSSFNLTAKADHMSTADGGSLLLWGYALGNPGGRPQYPGPTLIIPQGAAVTLTLTNNLAVNTSLVFPGMEGVVANGGTCANQGPLACEAPPGGKATTYKMPAVSPCAFSMTMCGVFITTPRAVRCSACKATP